MARLLSWNLSRLKTKSRPMTGPLPEMYLRDLTRMVEELQGVYLSGIQVGDPRRFAIPNPRFKDFPILYNPQILSLDELIPSEGEGCLSFPGMWVKVPRYKYVTISYRDGQWQEKKISVGNEDQEHPDWLLSKAIQHEIFHMDGVVLHDRITKPKERIKVQAQILKHSMVQNLSTGIPVLKEGPLELDPNNLPVLPVVERDPLVPIEGDQTGPQIEGQPIESIPDNSGLVLDASEPQE